MTRASPPRKCHPARNTEDNFDIMMRIDGIYKTLCELYDIHDTLDINRYLTMSLDGKNSAEVGSGSSNREMLLIRENDGYLEIGLFIDPSILTAIESDEPLNHLDELACAIEGTSHFLYFMERAQRGIPLSMLELELQAEVDKFLMIHLTAEKNEGGTSPQLFQKLFQDFSLTKELSPEEVERYTTANYFAAKYCAFLRDRFFNPLKMCELTSKAREFFSLNLEGKLSLLTP